MTSTPRQYTPSEIAAAVAFERDNNPGAHDELIADAAAFTLAGYQAPDSALDDASAQVMDWLDRKSVEARG